jgi:hypothetical protein
MCGVRVGVDATKVYIRAPMDAEGYVSVSEGPKIKYASRSKFGKAQRARWEQSDTVRRTEEGSAYISQLRNSFLALQYARFGELV